MESKSDLPATVDDYIARYPQEVQPILTRLRAMVREIAPEAEERISYGMPAYYLRGPLVYFAAHKNHIGLYPTPEGIDAFEEELATYKNSKGSVQFPLKQSMPYDLIRRIVQHRVAENLSRKA